MSITLIIISKLQSLVKISLKCVIVDTCFFLIIENIIKVFDIIKNILHKYDGSINEMYGFFIVFYCVTLKCHFNYILNKKW